MIGKSNELHELRIAAIKWIESDEGARALRESLKRQLEVVAKLNESMHVDKARLSEPFTV